MNVDQLEEWKKSREREGEMKKGKERKRRRFIFGKRLLVPKKLTDNNGRVSQLKFSPFI